MSGDTLSWAEAKKVAAYIKEHGIMQFLAIYNARKNDGKEKLLWGDEIEYLVVKCDPEKKTIKLTLRGHDLLAVLQKPEIDNPATAASLWRPEYGSFMIEGTPGQPYSGNPNQFIYQVQSSMIARRELAHQVLNEHEFALTLTNFPLMGMGDFCVPSAVPGGDVAQSLFTPDEIINHHLRFSTLTRNIRERRGSKVKMTVPLYRDTNTADFPKHPDRRSSEVAGEASEHWPLPRTIYMDSMAFGMGMCCLQMTFQCCNLAEARHFYDQLAVMAPIMLALSAATPIFRGFLSDQDARWNVIAGSVDDRTELERSAGAQNIPKSRYDSISTYISCEKTFKPQYNDVELVQNTTVYQQLRDAGVDELLARHVAHLFIRDPLVMYKSRIEIDDEHDADHFENIQSTNWQTVRFKPPPPGSPISWRVEFRPLEVQLTDFENAAFVVFVVLLTRVMMAFDLNLYLPISLVDQNMRVAHHRDAVNSERFWFRKKCSKPGCQESEDSEPYEQMTIDAIFNGTTDDAACGPRPGLLQLIGVYLDSVDIDSTTRAHIDRYMDFLSKRASGALITAAKWQRNFVRAHPAYQNDSIVTQEIAHDLCMAAHDVACGCRAAPELLGDASTRAPAAPQQQQQQQQ